MSDQYVAPLSAEIVLASLDPPQVFNFYVTVDQAIADQARANEYGARSGRCYEPMTYDAYAAAERAAWLSRPEQPIECARWIEMLEILPPVAWETTDTYSRFLMSERMSGLYTEQYIRRKTPDGDRCAVKLVDAFDRSTWME